MIDRCSRLRILTVLVQRLILALFAALLVGVLPAATPAHAAVVIVNSLADNGPGDCNSQCTLRDALVVAAPGDTIEFSVAGTIPLASTLTLTKDVTIHGPGATSLAVDGQNTVRVITVNSGVRATLAALTIQHGSADIGAGIYIDAANLTVSNSAVRNNSGVNNGPGHGAGAGIFNNRGGLTVENSTVTSNVSTDSGGGLYNIVGTTTLTNSTIQRVA